MQYKGTHGTSRSRALKIIEHGINLSNKGYSGPGVYFWSYEALERPALTLAHLWWKFALKQQQFDEDEDKSCAVLKAEISHPGDNEFLDLTGDERREHLLDLALQKGCKTHDDVAALSVFLIRIIESERKIPIALLKTYVPTPPRVNDEKSNTIKLMAGMAPCLVVLEKQDELIKSICLAEV